MSATSTACLKGAFEALLRGDFAERDRLCDRAKKLMEAESLSEAVERVLSADFYVTRAGVSVPTKLMAKTVGVLQ